MEYFKRMVVPPGFPGNRSLGQKIALDLKQTKMDRSVYIIGDVFSYSYKTILNVLTLNSQSKNYHEKIAFFPNQCYFFVMLRLSECIVVKLNKMSQCITV